MGFFGGIMKSMGDSLKREKLKALGENWQKIKSLPRERVESLIQDRIENGRIDMIAALAALSRPEFSSKFSDDDDENLANCVRGLKRDIELENSNLFDEIRESIKKFERNRSN